MPEATVLYSVTAVVVVGLIVWVALVLWTAKEPWARAAVAGAGALEASSTGAVSQATTAADEEADEELDADATSKATPIALASEGRRSSAERASLPDDKESKG